VSGLATAVAAGLVSILLLECFSVYMNATLEASSLQLGAASDQASLASASLTQRAQIDSVQVVNRTYIYLSVANSGEVSIPVTDLRQVDIILVYTFVSDGIAHAVWMPYTTTPSSTGWAVLSVTDGNGGAKLINPMNCPYPTYGLWDPTEVMTIGIALSSSNAINATDPLSVLLATPAGTTALAGS
jgi:hypothetical protein